MSDQSMSHAEIESLLAAYALDAVEPDEREVVERHVETCPRCQAELAEHLEVAGMLGNEGGEAPSEVWNSISTAIGLSSGDAAHSGPPPLDLDAFRADRAQRAGRVASSTRRLAAVGAAAAVVLIAALGGVVVSQQARLGDLETALDRESVFTDPSSQVVVLASAEGSPAATAVIGSGGRAYLVRGGLEPLGTDRTYQLWAVGDDGPISLGLLGADPGVVPFQVDADGEAVLAITDEPRGGSPSPTSDPLAIGEVLPA